MSRASQFAYMVVRCAFSLPPPPLPHGMPHIEQRPQLDYSKTKRLPLGACIADAYPGGWDLPWRWPYGTGSQREALFAFVWWFAGSFVAFIESI